MGGTRTTTTHTHTHTQRQASSHLGPLGDGVLGELPGQHEAHRRLDLLEWCGGGGVMRGVRWWRDAHPLGHALPACLRYLARGEGGLLGVAGELAGLGGEAVEDVVDEGVEDGDAALGDARVGVHLLEHLWVVCVVGWGREEMRRRRGRAGRSVRGCVRGAGQGGAGRATCLVDVGAVALHAGLLLGALCWGGCGEWGVLEDVLSRRAKVLINRSNQE